MNERKTMDAFGGRAITYDQDFSNTKLGRTQRAHVWKYLDSILDDYSMPLNILEINCGTGEDAIYLANKGHHVLATDISEQMLQQAHSKAADHALDNIKFSQLAIQKIQTITPDERYDLIFSNFGGLNCLNKEELLQLPKRLTSLLSEKGHIVLVLMPNFCFVEDLYMLLKRQPGKIFRRNRESGLPVPVGSQTVSTWYYSPNFLRKIFEMEKFNLNKVIVVGFTPSYLNPYFVKRPNFLKIWCRIGDLFRTNPRTTFLADHYLIHFTSTDHKKARS